MRKNTKRKEIETPPLTPEMILTFSKTDNVVQLRRFIEELKRENQRLLTMAAWQAGCMAEQAKEINRLLGIPEPKPKKEDDTFLYRGLN